MGPSKPKTERGMRVAERKKVREILEPYHVEKAFLEEILLCVPAGA
jgi:hypothetical protein